MHVMNPKARIIAFYLPQFHPIPENDKWWGNGFTEWTNVGKAKPLFKGHDQPKIPADLGYYDLRVPETREAQAGLAKKNGIEGFCYWHYWFGKGKKLLERPFHEVLESGKPDFPFCLAWANESWKGFAHGLSNRNVLIEQQYNGPDDYTAHFYDVLPAFKDKRYIKTEGKPVFMVYRPLLFPDIKTFITLWQKLAQKEGLDGIYFIGHTSFVHEINDILNLGFDAVNINRIFSYIMMNNSLLQRLRNKANRVFRGVPLVYEYKKVYPCFTGEEEKTINIFPLLCPNWDHTPRSGREGVVFQNATPELFEKHLINVLDKIADKPFDKKLVFLKSWNEWAEGNYMEPDQRFGTRYLEVLRKNIT
ncbi:MAG: glycoside hydrolase family 99-like domain-containing protein [Prolixibacteraceae bacterium]